MTKRGPRLENLSDVSKFLSRCIREVYTGKLDPALGGRLAYMCNILKSCLEMSDLEARVTGLEAAISQQQTGDYDEHREHKTARLTA